MQEPLKDYVPYYLDATFDHLNKTVTHIADGPIEPGSRGTWIQDKSLGSGVSGAVMRQELRVLGDTSPRVRAVKVVAATGYTRYGLPQEPIRTEIANLAHKSVAANHQYFTKLLCWYESEDKQLIYIALEYIDGGTLLSWVRSTPGGLGEPTIKAIGKQLVHGFSVLHAAGIMHRDFHPANTLIVSRNPPVVKISDFGESERIGYPIPPTQMGWEQYRAPEVDAGLGQYNESCDLWSLGCSLHILLTTRSPFYTTKANGWDRDFFEKYINSGSLDYPNKSDLEDANASHELLDFLRRLLVVDVDRRMTAVEAIDHSWMAEAHQSSDNGVVN